MKYFFDDKGRCLSVITEKVPIETETASTGDLACYIAEGDVGRTTTGVFLDQTFKLCNGLVVTLSAWGSGRSTIYVTINANYYPIGGLRIYYYCSGWGPASYVVTQNGTYSFGVPKASTTYYLYVGVDSGIVASYLGTASAGTCDCYCDCSCGSCFIAGSKVLMADYTLKNVEDLVIGDRVIGIDGNANTVVETETVCLGSKRPLFTFADGSLSWSSEHRFWVKDRGYEYWGTHDYNAWLRERVPHIITIGNSDREYILDEGLQPPIPIDRPVEYATIDGWKKQDYKNDRSAKNDTLLFHVRTDGTMTYIVNGYVVSSFASDKLFDLRGFKWNGLTKNI